MKCAWDAFLNLLPQWLKKKSDERASENLQELRLRVDKPPEFVTAAENFYINRLVSHEDIRFCINAASKYSPWAAHTSKYGYLTAPGGHRIGLCGQATVADDRVTGIQTPTSLCIRVARDIPDIAKDADQYRGSILIIGRPGCGKTTLLRDLIRRRSNMGNGSIAVIDEKSEIFPNINGSSCFDTGIRTDIMNGCNKAEGIACVLRNMGPKIIAVDEITTEQDCRALYNAGWCGVDIFATAHASGMQDLMQRPVYKPIISSGLFHTVIVLRNDKTWFAERMST